MRKFYNPKDFLAMRKLTIPTLSRAFLRTGISSVKFRSGIQCLNRLHEFKLTWDTHAWHPPFEMNLREILSYYGGMMAPLSTDIKIVFLRSVGNLNITCHSRTKYHSNSFQIVGDGFGIQNKFSVTSCTHDTY